VNVLDSPGSADLSAYVDFVALKHTVEAAAGGDFFAALYIFLMNLPGIMFLQSFLLLWTNSC
jgi:SAM-dependent MidA family methyltransferase